MVECPYITRSEQDARFVGFTPAKVPIDPVRGSLARVSVPETWGTFAQAASWAESNRGLVGFVALRDLLVIDFDGAIVDGEIHPWVRDWVDRIGGATEVSISGTGIQITVPMNDGLRQLLPHKRQVTSLQLPIERVDLITGNNAVALGRS
jgi:hypothetical protein